MIAQPQLIQADHQVIMSADEYLNWESQQEEKYEYENGKIIAMTGGTIPHSQIPLNLGALLLALLRGKGCKISISDAKVLVSPRKYYYPDVVCLAMNAIASPVIFCNILC